MTRKISVVGIIFSVITVILAVVGFVFYMINSGTAYFSNLGFAPVVAGCAVVAIVAEIVFIVVGLKWQPAWADILAIVVPALLFIAALTLAGSRVGGIAAIMTYENNAANMADLMSALVSIACCAVGGLVGIIAAFFDISKEA